MEDTTTGVHVLIVGAGEVVSNSPNRDLKSDAIKASQDS